MVLVDVRRILLLVYLCQLARWTYANEYRTLLSEDFELQTGTIEFADIKINYQLFDTPRKATPFVLFLHGAKYTSDTWVNLGTLKLLRQKGFRAIAIDLPGFGKTRKLPYVDNNMRAEVIKSAMEFAGKGLNVTQLGAVLVSPSMSARWAIPFLDRYGTMLKGWVPIAPVGVSQWGGPWEYTHKLVKLLAVYGDKDPMKQDADVLVKLFSKSRTLILSNAGHAAYMDATEQFHTQLANFVVTCLTPNHADL